MSRFIIVSQLFIVVLYLCRTFDSLRKFSLWQTIKVFQFLRFRNPPSIKRSLKKPNINWLKRGVRSLSNYSNSLFCVQPMLSQEIALFICDTFSHPFTINKYSIVLVIVIMYLSLNES